MKTAPITSITQREGIDPKIKRLMHPTLSNKQRQMTKACTNKSNNNCPDSPMRITGGGGLAWKQVGGRGSPKTARMSDTAPTNAYNPSIIESVEEQKPPSQPTKNEEKEYKSTKKEKKSKSKKDEKKRKSNKGDKKRKSKGENRQLTGTEVLDNIQLNQPVAASTESKTSPKNKVRQQPWRQRLQTTPQSTPKHSTTANRTEPTPLNRMKEQRTNPSKSPMKPGPHPQTSNKTILHPIRITQLKSSNLNQHPKRRQHQANPNYKITINSPTIRLHKQQQQTATKPTNNAQPCPRRPRDCSIL